jgi:transposase
MRFVVVKTEEQQSTLEIHRVRETLVAQKTQMIQGQLMKRAGATRSTAWVLLQSSARHQATVSSGHSQGALFGFRGGGQQGGQQGSE